MLEYPVIWYKPLVSVINRLDEWRYFIEMVFIERGSTVVASLLHERPAVVWKHVFGDWLIGSLLKPVLKTTSIKSPPPERDHLFGWVGFNCLDCPDGGPIYLPVMKVFRTLAWILDASVKNDISKVESFGQTCSNIISFWSLYGSQFRMFSGFWSMDHFHHCLLMLTGRHTHLDVSI